MPISLGLVKLMNGTIDLNSVENVGTTITMLLLLATSSHSEHTEVNCSQIKAPNLKNKTILLAEDNEINQVIFCAML